MNCPILNEYLQMPSAHLSTASHWGKSSSEAVSMTPEEREATPKGVFVYGHPSFNIANEVCFVLTRWFRLWMLVSTKCYNATKAVITVGRWVPSFTAGCLSLESDTHTDQGLVNAWWPARSKHLYLMAKLNNIASSLPADSLPSLQHKEWYTTVG